MAKNYLLFADYRSCIRVLSTYIPAMAYEDGDDFGEASLL